MESQKRSEVGRRHFLIGTAGAAVMVPAARAEVAYPSRVVMIHHPSPGGSLDGASRVIAQKLQATWSQPVLVEVKPGAAGAVAASLVARAPADGHTLLVIGSAVLTNLLGRTDVGYRQEDLAPVCLVALIPVALGVRSSLGVKTMSEFISLARSAPGKITYASHGQGSNGHIVGELLSSQAGVQMVHVPYKGEAPALLDLVSGNVDAALLSLGGISRYAGKIVPLAVASPSRLPAFPDTSTFLDAGWGKAAVPGWAAMFAPAKTAPAVIAKIAAETGAVIALPDVTSRMLELGFVPSGAGPARLSEFLHEQMQVIRPLVANGRIAFG